MIDIPEAKKHLAAAQATLQDATIWVARAEALLAQAHKRLLELGINPTRNPMAQIAKMEKELEELLANIERDLAAIQGALG